nr:hypothetical protein [Candidatus Sigynarchaeum springense]
METKKLFSGLFYLVSTIGIIFSIVSFFVPYARMEVVKDIIGGMPPTYTSEVIDANLGTQQINFYITIACLFGGIYCIAKRGGLQYLLFVIGIALIILASLAIVGVNEYASVMETEYGYFGNYEPFEAAVGTGIITQMISGIVFIAAPVFYILKEVGPLRSTQPTTAGSTNEH